MTPVELFPASQISSSSSTLWAQPSKEWVIPAKPKPGRKPKKETTGAIVPQNDHEEIPSGSRRVQNRAAQRAFRERKQTQLAELQARLQSYEQGDIERNVALQNIAKKMKDENDELRKENQFLKEKIARLERERDEFLVKDRKRTYDDASASSLGLPPFDNYVPKRARIDTDVQGALLSSLHLPSPSSLVSSPADAVTIDSASPGEHENPNFHAPPLIASHLSLADKPSCRTGEDTVESFNCILCSPDEPCVCRQLTVEQATHSLQLPLQSENLDQLPTVPSKQSIYSDIPPVDSGSILNSLPAFQAPVPIRRKAGASRVNVFPVTPIAAAPSSPAARCSGDPDNCHACADDNFGRAFCQAIGDTLNSSLPCTDCPKRASQSDEILLGGCCGDVSKCGSCGIAPVVSSPTLSRGPETIPTDDAWRQLKSHPNVAFADLTLLAEVVARRSKCTGSRVVVSPALESATALPPLHEPIPARGDVFLSGAEGGLHQKQRQREPPPQLVPQHVLIECGRRRVREVNVDGVMEALRLLDQKFAHTR